jgi:PEP-CTERM motif
MPRFLTAALVATLMAGGVAPSHASTVIAEVSGIPIGAAGVSPGNAISFTTTSVFTDVTISALLYSSSGDPGTGSATVYLTDSIGAGTTTANEIARATLTDLPVLFSTSTPEVVFTGLTLPAGTYYVIEASDTGSAVGADWGEPEFPVETTAPGVTIHTDLIANSLASYSPASAFGADTGDGFAFSITGSPVPEPSTWAMMMLGFASLGYAGFRSARARRLGAP